MTLRIGILLLYRLQVIATQQRSIGDGMTPDPVPYNSLYSGTY